MKSVIIIPARMDSQRFPGMPLADCGGVPLLQRTYDAAKQTQADAVMVASPDREICNYCRDAGITWKPTRDDHPSGTHRCAEIAERMRAIDIVVNWQVDEPLVDPRDVDRLIENPGLLRGNIATLVSRIDEFDAHDRDVVKAIVLAGTNPPFCQWFSRAAMQGAWGHLGVYAFDQRTLLQLGEMESTQLSKLESLEQLTWIEHGKNILAMSAGFMPRAVNTQTDLDEVAKYYENKIPPQGAD